MHGLLKKVWVVLFFFMILGLLAMVPLDKYQKAYLDEYHRIKAKPQKRVDAAYTYVEYLENGGEPTSTLTAPEAYNKTFRPRRVIFNDPRKRKPVYIRDKNNPKILHPYRGR